MHNRSASAHQPGPWQYASGNRLTQWGQQQQATRYQYNHSGHITQKTQGGTNTPGSPNASATSYHYDAAQRLVHIEQNGQTIARYHYDPKGRRIAKTTGQGSGQTTTWYIYAEEGLIAEINEQGQTQKSYGWEPDSPWGTKILWQADHGSAATKTYHYIHSDHLGTPQIATDKNGNQTWAQVSEAFGKATISANASTEINIRFPGQYYDQETGTHYNFHRDYDPSTGRYLQSDPIGLDGGVNFYIYSNMNSLLFFDNVGLKSCPFILRIIGRCDGSVDRPDDCAIEATEKGGNCVTCYLCCVKNKKGVVAITECKNHCARIVNPGGGECPEEKNISCGERNESYA
ncbi:RHS repeat-associated core domain-containing protein [Vandammella animalimorsus]|uniref:RHS repeat domain-containing protein n=1 Tax=Vandammella animalimorsus TaxID=2029117 RepID=UPI00325BBC97